MEDQLVVDLKAARAVIEKPEAWTRNYLAKNVSGRPVDPRDVDASCFCMLGACDRGAATGTRSYTAGFFLSNYVPQRSISGFNDNPKITHADVLVAFDRAIAAASDPSKRL